jgi:hypothetical protein
MQMDIVLVLLLLAILLLKLYGGESSGKTTSGLKERGAGTAE